MDIINEIKELSNDKPNPKKEFIENLAKENKARNLKSIEVKKGNIIEAEYNLKNAIKSFNELKQKKHKTEKEKMWMASYERMIPQLEHLIKLSKKKYKNN